MGGREEERIIDSHFTGWQSIVHLPRITVTICLVGSWMINNNLKRRRTTIFLAQEEEQTM
jgi:hypothetical protein